MAVSDIQVVVDIDDDGIEPSIVVDPDLIGDGFEDMGGLNGQSEPNRGDARLSRPPTDRFALASASAERARALWTVLEREPINNEAFAQLEEIYRAEDRYAEVAELILFRVEHSRKRSERVRLLRALAAIYEQKLADPHQAFDALLLAWSLDFAEDESFEALTRVARATRRFGEALETAQQGLLEAQDKDTRVTLWLQCAEWHGNELGQPDVALRYYEQVLAYHPSSVELIWSMVEQHERMHQWDEAAQLCLRIANATTDPAELANAYVKLGDLAVQLDARELATSHYERALAAVPDHVEALRALDLIYADSDESSLLVDALERKKLAAQSPDDAVAAKLALAEAHEGRPSELPRAVELYDELRALDPANVEALEGLARVYTRMERWVQLASVLDAHLDVSVSDTERSHLLHRVGVLYQDRLHTPTRAAERLEQLVDIDPMHEDALQRLGTLYRQMRQWDLLAHSLERLAAITGDRAERGRVYKALGDTYLKEVRDEQRAVECYVQALSVDDEDADVLRALADLYERAEDIEAALDMMEQLAPLVTDRHEQGDLLCRMARLHESSRNDEDAAIELYQLVIERVPAHVEALASLRRLHAERGDWNAVATLLRQEARSHGQPKVAAQLFVELGRVYENSLEEHDRAVQAFEHASKSDPDNDAAASWLVDHYMRQRRFEDAYPILDRMFKRSRRRTSEEQHGLAYMLARCAAKMDRSKDAIRAYERAYELDPNHVPTLKGLAGAHYNAKQWDKAARFYQMLLVGSDRDSIGDGETVFVFYRLGICKRELGDRRAAALMFDKALQDEPGHRPSLEALIELHGQRHEFKQVIHYKRLILETIDDVGERVKMLDEIARLWMDKYQSHVKAIEAWSEALTLRPDDHKVLHELLNAYQACREWQSTIEIIERLSELDRRASAKSKYAYTIGVIYRDELRDDRSALAKLDLALDHDGSNLKAFEAVDKILTAHKDWRGLERAYRKMIHRVLAAGGNDELKHGLFHSLGLIYRDRLCDYEAAAEVFQTAASLKPGDGQEKRILAELYTLLPHRSHEAIGEHHGLLTKNPTRVESLRSLYQLYFDVQAYDRAWCVGRALVFLRQADHAQQQFVADYAPRGPVRPRGRMTRELWFKELMHPSEDRYLSKIMELIAPAALAVRQASDRALKLQGHEPADVENSSVTVARAFGFVARLLDVPVTPRLYLQPASPGGIAHVPGSSPPAVVCGSTLLSGYRPEELMFVLGRFLTYYQAEHFARTLFVSHTELRLLLLAALRISGLGAAEKAVDQWAAQLTEHVSAPTRDALRQVCRRFIDAGGSADVKAWMRGVELTAIRTGLLLSNDLGVACRMTQALAPDGSIDVPPREKLEEIMRFSVSEEYFRLRESLGIVIGG